MIGTTVSFSVIGLNEAVYDTICDQFAALETICPDMLDWSVGTTLSTGTVEVDMTINLEDATKAAERAAELVDTAMRMGHFESLTPQPSDFTTEPISA